VEMTPADIKVFLETLWLRADDIPCTPPVRVSFHSVVLLLGIGGFRRGMVLGLKFRQVQLAIVRDPDHRKKIRLVATITIARNKLKRAARGKSRSSKQFSHTHLSPCPYLPAPPVGLT